MDNRVPNKGRRVTAQVNLTAPISDPVAGGGGLPLKPVERRCTRSSRAMHSGPNTLGAMDASRGRKEKTIKITTGQPLTPYRLGPGDDGVGVRQVSRIDFPMISPIHDAKSEVKLARNGVARRSNSDPLGVQSRVGNTSVKLAV